MKNQNAITSLTHQLKEIKLLLLQNPDDKGLQATYDGIKYFLWHYENDIPIVTINNDKEVK